MLVVNFYVMTVAHFNNLEIVAVKLLLFQMMIKLAIRRCHVLGDNCHEDEDTFALYEVEC